MADCKKQGRKLPEKTHNGKLEMGTSLDLNVSLPIDPAVTTPLYQLCNAPVFQQGSALKNLYSSPFGSMVAAGSTLKGKVWRICTLFEAARATTRPPDLQPPSSSISKSSKHLLTSPPETSKSTPPPLPDLKLPGTEDRVVIYFTSLRGIRRTFQDCHSIRMIFRGFRVNLDERDLSMDAEYRKELQRVLGERNVSLPHVFVKGIYIGGADVIRQMLENGELLRLIKGLPLSPQKPCEACNDVRFIPCTNCDGSRKVFDEDEQLAKRCNECNENGLVRCPLCCL